MNPISIATPFRTGLARKPEQGTMVLSVTEATLSGNRIRTRPFWTHVTHVSAVLEQTPGLIGYAMRRGLTSRRAWTMTLWQDETALESFLNGHAHQQAVQLGMSSVAETRVARLTLDASAAAAPSWDLAWRALEAASQRG